MEIITDRKHAKYNPDALMNSEEAAVLLRVTKNRVQQYAREWSESTGAAGLPHRRVYMVYEFRVEDVLTFDDERKAHNADMDRQKRPGRRFNVVSGHGGANSGAVALAS